jgi:hypothetical protein
MPVLEDSPEIVLAFEILSGERPLPPGKDRTALLKHHRVVLRAAMDRAWENSVARILHHLQTERRSNSQQDRATGTQHKALGLSSRSIALNTTCCGSDMDELLRREVSLPIAAEIDRRPLCFHRQRCKSGSPDRPQICAMDHSIYFRRFEESAHEPRSLYRNQ